jgi:hypothetical protein
LKIRPPEIPSASNIPMLPDVLARASDMVASIGNTSDAILARMGAMAGVRPVTLGGVAGHAANLAGGIAGSAGALAGQAANVLGTGVASALADQGGLSAAGRQVAGAGMSALGGIGRQMSGAGATIGPLASIASGMAGRSPLAAAAQQASAAASLHSFGRTIGAPQIAGAMAAGANAIVNVGASLVAGQGPAGVFEFAGKVPGMVQSAVLGATQVLQINQFVRSQVDLLIGGIGPQSRMIRDWSTSMMMASWARVDTIVDSAALSAKRTLKELGEVPQKASEIVVEAKEIKKTALARRDALRKHAARFRARR